MWSVFKVHVPIGEVDRGVMASGVRKVVDAGAADDVVVRGWYDVAGFRADADLMVWWHAPTSEALQAVYHKVRRSALGRHLQPVWSQVALHRPAEFNKSHIPAFLAEEEPRRHMREELPFYTGRRTDLTELVANLP